MADERAPLTTENLREVLDRLNDVLEEAASLRKDVVRQLTEQGSADRQRISPAPKRKKARVKR
jgi:hypothetical protein